MLRINTNSNPNGSAIKTNIDGSGRLTKTELAAIGETALRGSNDINRLRKTSQSTSNIFARFISAFKQWRQAEADIYAFEHGNYERMVDYFMDQPEKSSRRKIFEPRMQKLANQLALDQPDSKTYTKSIALLSQLQLAGITPNADKPQ